MTLAQFLNSLKRRWFLMLFVLISTISATYYFGTKIPKTYLSTASVVLNLQSVDLVTDQSTRIPVGAHTSIIRSKRVANLVVERLSLNVQQKYIQRYVATNKEANITINEFIVEDLLNNLSVGANSKSPVIQISYSSNDPVFSSTVANAFVDAYIETVIEMNNDAPIRTAKWFGKEVEQQKKKFLMAKQKLEDYKKDNQKDDFNSYELEAQYLNQLTSRLYSKQTELQELELKIRNISADLKNFNEIANDEGIQVLDKEIANARIEFFKIASSLDKNHPEYQRLSTRLNALRNFRLNEVKSAYNRLLNSKKAIEIEYESLKSEVNHQNAKLLNMQKGYDDLVELQSIVEMAQNQYNASLLRLNELQLQSKSNLSESEITVLNVATPPISHDKPKMMKIMAMGVFAALILALTLGMLREWVSRKIVIDDDVEVSGDLKVIGHIVDGYKAR